MSDSAPLWRLFIDTGGTFTDCLGLAPDGSLHRAKVLSSSSLRGEITGSPLKTESPANTLLKVRGAWPPVDDLLRGLTFHVLGSGEEGQREENRREVVRYRASTSELELSPPLASGAQADGGQEPLRVGSSFELRSPEEAPVLAARLVLGCPLGSPLPPIALRLATTRGTNALLERRGAKTALFITEGFKDLLHIGTQQRPDLFSLDIRRPAPLPARVVEVSERLAADGSVLRPLDLPGLEPQVAELLADGFESAAVVLMHSFRRSCHEDHVAAFLRRQGFQDVSSSAELAPRIGFLARAQTAVVDAYLGPVIRRYLERVEGALGEGSTVHVMTSAGGLVRAGEYRPKDSLLSGPAGGVVGAAAAGRAAGFEEIIAFDMGGTSTDVSRIRGDFEYRYDQSIGGIELLTPALAIETVAAGGGSLCRFDGHRLLVGPESAGAVPGPACYGAGGPLAITDVNLLLGRLDPNGFEIPIDLAAAERAADDLAAAVSQADTSRESLLEGLLRIANERMADAIRTISIRRGYDPRSSVLVAFGGAGPQHACAVADLLGMDSALIPADAALLSAVGLRAAVLERFVVRQVLAPMDSVLEAIPGWLRDLEEEAREQVLRERSLEDQSLEDQSLEDQSLQAAPPVGEVRIRRRTFHLRFVGQESTLPVEGAPLEDLPLDSMESAFRQAHEERFGYSPSERAVELESIVVVACGEEEASAMSRSIVASPPSEGPRSRRQAFFAGRWQSVAVVQRESLEAGEEVEGPALVFERHSASVVEPGWTCRRGQDGALLLTRKKEA